MIWQDYRPILPNERCVILIIGCGHVGSTIADILEDVGQEIIRIDPKLNDNKISDFKDRADGAIIAVPTPTINGECDVSMVDKAVTELGDMRILIKSTVLPNLLEKYHDKVIYSPEFLREEHAVEDYEKQKCVVWGGEKLQIVWWMNRFQDVSKQNAITDRATASMVKYVYNCWLASKVTFFHELYANSKHFYNYMDMVGILGAFENIGPSHMKVPVGAPKLGFDGNCFPKDMEAFTSFSNSEILKKVIEVNKMLPKGDKK